MCTFITITVSFLSVTPSPPSTSVTSVPSTWMPELCSNHHSLWSCLTLSWPPQHCSPAPPSRFPLLHFYLHHGRTASIHLQRQPCFPSTHHTSTFLHDISSFISLVGYHWYHNVMYTEVDSQSGESQSAFIYSDFTKNMHHTNVEIEAVLQGEADMQHQRSGRRGILGSSAQREEKQH